MVSGSLIRPTDYFLASHKVRVADAHGCLVGLRFRKVHVMSKRDDADYAFRSSDRPLTEYEKEQKALRKNLERLRAERLAREAANSKES